MLRPLVLAWPDDPEVADLSDQALLGPDLLIAPVLRPGTRQRAVYFPGGLWIDLETGRPVEGGRWHLLEVQADRMPTFVRGGAILPRFGPAPSTAHQDRGCLDLRCFAPAAQGACAPEASAVDTVELEGEWYDDDGTSISYQAGSYNHWRFRGSVKDGQLALEITRVHEGYDSPTRLVRVLCGSKILHEGHLEPGFFKIDI